jgi:hypothetical protein
MRLRTRVNQVLTKTIGYRLVRASPEAAAPPAGKQPTQERPAQKKPAQRKPAQQIPAQKKPASEKKPAEKKMPAESKNDPNNPQDYDADTRATIELVRERTMTHHTKVQSLIEAVRYVQRHQIPGAIVECGVWRGGSMLAVANTLQQLGVTDRDLYLFDTFTGMTPPTERDVRINEGKHASEFLSATEYGPMAWSRPEHFVATLDDVKEGFTAVDYPEERIHYVVGKVEETVPEQSPDVISILRLDTDWYESTRHELEQLYHRLSPGGVLILDDYGTWQGAKEAVDEFLEATGEPLLLNRVHRSRIAVRPGLKSTI